MRISGKQDVSAATAHLSREPTPALRLAPAGLPGRTMGSPIGRSLG